MVVGCWPSLRPLRRAAPHRAARRTPFVFAFVLAKKDQVPWRGCVRSCSVSLAWSGLNERKEEDGEEQGEKKEVEVDDEEEEEEEGEEENEGTREKSDGI